MRFNNQNSNIFLIMSSLLFMVFVFGCSNENHVNLSYGSGSIGFSIKTQSSPAQRQTSLRSMLSKADVCQAAGISEIMVTVYDNDGNELAAGGPWPCSAQSETLSVTAGSNRRLVVDCFDDQGNIKYHGEKAGIIVLPNKTNNIGVINASVFISSLSKPANNTFPSCGSFAFQWNPVEHASKYKITISENIDLSNPVIDSVIDETSFQTNDLSCDIKYYWRVFAIDSMGNQGAGSDQWAFTSKDSRDEPLDLSDADGDGFTVDQGDCDDNDPAVNPGAVEIPYNEIDDDCNPATLDDDLDQDGYSSDVDCDDNDPTIHPGAMEIPNNGIDENCNGMDLHVIFVDCNTSASKDGLSWKTALKTIQEAVDAAEDGYEIWIKKGRYLIDSQINIDKAVSIYGGFIGDEISRGRRNQIQNPTIVDGQQKTRCFFFSGDAGLDGLTIFEGNAEYMGGGISIDSSSAVITNCVFLSNTTYGYCDSCYGGAIYSLGSSTTITNCVFLNNIAVSEYDSYGGAICNQSSSSIITNCTFLNNLAINNYKQPGYGGAICNKDSSLVSITNSILWLNSIDGVSDDILNYNSSPIVSHCDITGGYDGPGNISRDPLFVDPPSANVHLNPGSPCIDSGLNTALSIFPDDYEGDPRILDGNDDGTAIADMGADEYTH